jgi:hypothetical protein
MARRPLRPALPTAVRWLLSPLGDSPHWLIVLSVLLPPVVAVALAYLASGTSVTASPVARTINPTSGGQSTFIKRISGDQKALFRNYFSATVPQSVLVGHRYTLTVDVRSRMVRLVSDSAVLVGGSVGVTAQCLSINCTPIRPTRQDVTRGDGTVTWQWIIEAQSPSNAQIYVVVTTYDQGSSSALYVNPTRLISIKALSTWGYKWARVGAVVKWVIVFVGATGLLGFGRWLWPRMRRRLHKRRDAKGEAKPKPSDPEPAAPTGHPS